LATLLYQANSGYCYNSDSIFLYEFIRKFSPKGELLDVGCGVGVISLLLAKEFDIDVTLCEKQEIMANYAKLNFSINSISNTLIEGDFLKVDIDKKFDFIISNPPFYNSNSVTQSENSVINSARYAHHLPMEDFIKRVKQLLKPRGRFILCYDAKQSDRLLQILRENKLTPENICFVHPKIDRAANIIMVSARAGSKSMTKIEPPLIVFDDNGEYTNRAKVAFLNANTHSIKGDF
jgi:tRNA1(Val) A37 N6-methylase TrmN6